MTALQATKRYFDAWNNHKPDAIVAALQPGGTYQDPLTGGLISGPALAEYTAGLFEAFPNLAFEIVSESETAPDTVGTGRAVSTAAAGVSTATTATVKTTGSASTLSTISTERAGPASTTGELRLTAPAVTVS
ncbi:MAG: nuclear transport factor 2 family protein, partial [Chloroflexi bacterium]|nr:nuclear transport factor 2 family protein [Chloroflexota bacterium]